MTTRRGICLAFLTLVAATTTTLVLSQDKPAKESSQHNTLMEKKLEYAQNILAGLTLEDFDLVAKNAKAMNSLNVLEKWMRADTPAYRAQLKVFQFANSELVRLSEAKNLDGSTLAYVQLTLSCVNCHKHVRSNPE